MRQDQRGLTLIELLVAIAIFAILGVMSWRALSSALDSRDQLKREFGQWQRLSRALSLVENDLAQITVREPNNSQSLPTIRLNTLPDGRSRIVFWRMQDTAGARLTGFEFADGSLQLLRWRTEDYSLEPQREILIPGVTAVRWLFTDKQASTAWQPRWPLQANGAASDLPAGIKLEVDIDGIGSVSRTYALR